MVKNTVRKSIHKERRNKTDLTEGKPQQGIKETRKESRKSGKEEGRN